MIVNTMGDMGYHQLPKYIAVRVSEQRWQIAELVGEIDSDGYSPPAYNTVGKRLSQGDCNNRLRELQAEQRKAAKATTA